MVIFSTVNVFSALPKNKQYFLRKKYCLFSKNVYSHFYYSTYFSKNVTKISIILKVAKLSLEISSYIDSSTATLILSFNLISLKDKYFYSLVSILYRRYLKRELKKSKRIIKIEFLVKRVVITPVNIKGANGNVL